MTTFRGFVRKRPVGQAGLEGLEFHASGFPARETHGARPLSGRAVSTETDQGGNTMKKQWKQSVWALPVAAGLLAWGSVARAATADGTLITNVACATFSSAAGSQFAVSYCATSVVPVANPCIALQKTANPTTQASGGTVTYCLWVVNCSPSTSAFNITITDNLPANVSYAGGYADWNGGSGGTWFPTTPPVGQTATFTMRFVLTQLGMNRSAMACFQVQVL
jgi:uncharacterized repeat protein (TIGR01451 family)